MPVNVSPEYAKAEKEHLEAETIEDKIRTLQKLISCAPAHKGGENLRAQLKTRYKMLVEKLEKTKKQKKSLGGGKQGIKKEDMQGVLIGFENSGKSTLISHLSKTKLIFNKKDSYVKMMNYFDVKIQLVFNPAMDSESYDRGLTHGADIILIVVDKINEIEEVQKKLAQIKSKKIVVFTKSDLKDEDEKRKIAAQLQSKKYNFVLVSSFTEEGFEELKKKMFNSFEKIRVYTKEPGKEKSNNPIILNPHSTIKDVAEKILKGFSKRVIETKIWGPSSKFSGQIVGLKHELKDGDVVEFKTR